MLIKDCKNIIGKLDNINQKNLIEDKNNNNDNDKQNKIKEKNDKLNELTYNQAKKLDKSSFFQMFFSIAKHKFKIIEIFFFQKDFTHKSLTLSLFILDFFIELSTNAFLFSDDIISEKYHNNGNIKFFTSIVIALVSNIFSWIILYICKKLTNYNEVLEIIAKEEKKDKRYFILYKNFKYCYCFKLIIYFIIEISICLFATYYLFIFCAVYQNAQGSLFLNFFIGELINFGKTLGIILLIVIFRKISILKGLRQFYVISRFIDDNL